MSRALLEVVGDISRYRAELAKVPGVTDAQAARAALAWERRMHAAQTKAAKDAEKAAKKSAEFWGEVSKVAGGVTLGSLAAAGLQKAADLTMRAASGLVAMGRDALAAQDAVGDFAEDAGLAADRVAALRLASIGAGEEFGQFEGTLSAFVLTTKKAQDGVAKSAKLFETYGIAVKDVDGRSRDVNAVLDDTLRVLSEIEDPGQRAGAAMRLLGSEGGKLLRVLGGRELSDWVETMRAAGVDLERLAANADAWDLANRRLATSMDIAGQSLAAAFGGEAAELVDSLSTGVVQFAVLAEKAAERADQAFSLQGMVNLAEFAFAVAHPVQWAMARAGLAKVGLDTPAGKAVGSFLDEVQAETEKRMAAIREIVASGLRGERPQAEQRSLPTANVAPNRPEELGATIDTSKFEEAARVLEDASQKLYNPEASTEVGRITEKWDALEVAIMKAAEALDEYDLASQLLTTAGVQRAEELRAANQRAADATAKATAQAERETSQTAANAVESYARIFDGLVNQAFDMARTLVASQKRSAIEQFEINKKLALAEIGINTSRAAMSAYASASNYIQGIVQAALVTAAGVAQAVLVSRQRITLHSGTVGGVGGVPAMNDEYDRRLKRGEVVVSAPVVQSNGGPRAVEDRLRGGDRPSIMRVDFGRGKVLDLLVELVGDAIETSRRGLPRTVGAF